MMGKPTVRQWRIVVQTLCLTGFLWLFVATEYRGLDTLPYPVSLLFRLDPLAALADAFAPGPFGWTLLWPALLLMALTAVFGRFFCGWICPLGTTLDGCGRFVGRGQGRTGRWRSVKYVLLVFLVVSALMGLQLFGLFDPLSIFLRSLTLSIYPVYNLTLNAGFDFFYTHQIPLVSPLVNGVYPFFRDHLMAFHQPAFMLGVLTLAAFLLILLLERLERRFWCRNLCPLGALLGLCSQSARLRRIPILPCADCKACHASCRMAALDPGGCRSSECVLCHDCAGVCPQEKVHFAFKKGDDLSPGVDLPRRALLTSVAGAVLIAPVSRVTPAPRLTDSYLLRPPGAVAEREFLDRCIRCGECMKVCIGQTLHPALFQAGGTGIWSPLLLPRLGYCEFNCTLCGQVCPTGALRPLSLEEKHRTIIGTAVIDRNRCLPFARSEECLVCEEHCPTGKKAIVFDPVTVVVQGEKRALKQPRMLKELCVGCGICETRCPVEGQSAIRVTNAGESRHVDTENATVDAIYG